MVTKRSEFKALSEELIHLEGQLFIFQDFSERNSDALQDKYDREMPTAPTDRSKKWWIVTAILGVITLINNDFRLRLFSGILFEFLVVALIPIILASKRKKAYKKELIDYQEKVAEIENDREVDKELCEELKQHERRREEIINTLYRMCAEEPSLDGNYWWKCNWDPVEIRNQLPGYMPDFDRWKVVITHHPTITERNQAPYLANMEESLVRIPASKIQPILNSGPMLYCNDTLLVNRLQDLLLMHLYAYTLEPIEEVIKHTTRERVDKEGEMRSFQERENRKEIWDNLLRASEYGTDNDLYLQGKMSNSFYLDRSLSRSWREDNLRDELDSMPDYEECARYSKGFNGLAKLQLYECATILLSAEKGREGECAAIILPRKDSKIVQMVIRISDMEKPFGGRLEYYDDIPGYREIQFKRMPSVRVAAECLFTPEKVEELELRPMNLLRECPAGLTQQEFAYLMLFEKNLKEWYRE